MSPTRRSTISTRYRQGILFCILAMFGSVLWGISLIRPSEEIARARNAFIASVGKYDEFTWGAKEIPSSFLLETGDIPKKFLLISNHLTSSIDQNSSNWRKALNIAEHLASGPGRGDGIMSNTLDTYKTIMSEKMGYCADYSQVFNGLAYTLNIPVREWGMAFDGFGGYGHAFNEVYDNKLNKWVFIDSFYSFYAVDSGSGEPLSLLEFRQLLLEGADSEKIKIIPIVADRFGFKSDRHALAYYRKGMDQFYLWWGNNVFSYDDNFWVEKFGRLSRALEQGVGILLGIHPKIKIIRSDTNGEAINILFHKRRQILMSAAIFLIAAIVALVCYRKLAALSKPSN